MLILKNRTLAIFFSFLIFAVIPWNLAGAKSAGVGEKRNPFSSSFAGTTSSKSAPALLQTFPGFPSTGILDNFDRANGSLGMNWTGSTSGYQISGNQLDVGTSQDIYWKADYLGIDQEVYVTLSTLDPGATEIGLILKSQDNNTYTSGQVDVVYQPSGSFVQVWTYDNGWVQHGADIPVTFSNGDRFGARARADGSVEVYQNGVLLTVQDVSSWQYYALGGYVGLFNIAASAALLDNFGGGTLSNSPTLTSATQACIDPTACNPVVAQQAYWRCDIPSCTTPEWMGAVISWPSWAAYENNARTGDNSRTVFAADDTKLYPYMGSWAEGCTVTAVSGRVLIIEWQRGTDKWSETFLDPGQSHIIHLVSPQDNAMLESPGADIFSVSLANCDPQNIRSTPTATPTATGTASPTPTFTATASPTNTATATNTPSPTVTLTPTPVTYPVVASITRTNTNPNQLDLVDFTVNFTNSVTGVGKDDFALRTTGVSGATVTSVSGAANRYTVSVSTGTGNGTIRLDLVDNNTIVDAASHPLGGPTMTDGNFTDGEIYSIIKDQTFNDVSSSYWASDHIEQLYNAGITGGCSFNPLSYCPEAMVTRAQMAVFLLRGIHGSSYSPPAIGGSTGFLDVPADYWAAAWIKELAAEKITGGCGTGKYCPDAPVTRDQMAVFLLRSKHGASYGPPDAGSGTGFSDVQANHWAAAWIKQLVTEGITSGCGNGKYCPAAQVSRAQMAVFLVKTFGLP